MAELSVQIGADVSDLLKKLNLSEKELKELALTAAKTGKTVEQVLKESGKGGKALQQGTQLASKGIADLGKSTANAVPTLTSFSQVIQDAPYGIRGVANNITQLTSQFGYLQKSTGGTGAALKAMLGTLAGPAGILLAVSAVTSLLVSYGDKLKFAADKTSELAKASKDFVGDAIAEKVALESLLTIARDEAATKVQRSAAIEEINKKYSKYLGFLDEDSVKTDQVTTSVKNLTLALIQKAKIEGLASVISEKTADAAEDLVGLDLKRQNSLATIRGELKRLNKENAFFNKVIDETDLGTLEGVNRQLKNVQKASTGASSSTLSFLLRSVTEFKNLGNEIKEVNSDLDDTLLPLVRLQEGLKKQVFEIDAKINIDEGAVNLGTISTKDIAKVRESISKKNAETLLFIEQDLANDIGNITQDQWDSINNIYKSSGAELVDHLEKLKEDEAFKLELETDKFRADFAVSQIELIENRAKQLGDQLSRIGFDPNQFNLEGLNLEQLDNLNTKLKDSMVAIDVFSNAISSAFSAMASQISQSLSTGNAIVDSFVSSIISSLTQMLADLAINAVTQAIVGNLIAAAAGVAAAAQGVLIATSAAAALGPFGFAALPGLLAATQLQIGAALAVAKIPKFATGGFTSPEGKRDETGFRVAGLVHEGEYIVPKKVLQTKAGAQMVNQLEDLRKYNRVPNVSNFNDNGFVNSFASGGFTSNNFANKLVLIPFGQPINLLSGMSNITNNPIQNNVGGEIYGEVVLRGTSQVIQMRRAEKKMKRYGSL